MQRASARDRQQVPSSTCLCQNNIPMKYLAAVSSQAHLQCQQIASVSLRESARGLKFEISLLFSPHKALIFCRDDHDGTDYTLGLFI